MECTQHSRTDNSHVSDGNKMKINEEKKVNSLTLCTANGWQELKVREMNPKVKWTGRHWLNVKECDVDVYEQWEKKKKYIYKRKIK